MPGFKVERSVEWTKMPHSQTLSTRAIGAEGNTARGKRRKKRHFGVQITESDAGLPLTGRKKSPGPEGTMGLRCRQGNEASDKSQGCLSTRNRIARVTPRKREEEKKGRSMRPMPVAAD